MVSVNQDRAFPGKHLLQLGIRLGYLSVASRVALGCVSWNLTRWTLNFSTNHLGGEFLELGISPGGFGWCVPID